MHRSLSSKSNGKGFPMNATRYLCAWLLVAIGLISLMAGCRSQQTAQIVKPGEKQMVGSHEAGGETFVPLVDTAVGNLLSRHSQGVQPQGFAENAPPAKLRICFVGLENKSSEEIGDFKDQIYQLIDSRLLNSQVYQSVSQRYVQAGLTQCRLRPEELMIPSNMQMFTQALEQQGQPFDYMLYATITSGTTHDNKDYQRNYLLTLEMLNVHNGQYDKESAQLEKKYNVSTMAKVKSWFPF
jgi:hypothetical protein